MFLFLTLFRRLVSMVKILVHEIKSNNFENINYIQKQNYIFYSWLL